MPFLIRYVDSSAVFACCYNNVQIMPKKATRKIKVQQAFDKKPKETLRSWAIRVVKMLISQTGEESCSVHAFVVCPKIDIIKLKYHEIFGKEIKVIGAVYKILTMRARGQWHIYGLTDKQFYERMSKHEYNQKQSKELLKMFKEDRIKTKAKV